MSLVVGTNETIRCGAVAGKGIGVPYASRATVGVGVGAELELVPPCPHAASRMSKESRNDRKRREEMTWERI